MDDSASFPNLSQEHLAQLKSSAISDEVIKERGYRTETSKVYLKNVEARLAEAQRRVPGLLVPLYRVGRPEPHAYVLRPDRPRTRDGKDIKYETPKGVTPGFDVLPRFASALGDPSKELWITEGAKKADALASVGLPAINLSGVFAWRGKNSSGGKLALPDFEEVAWNARSVVLAFDSDVIRKPQVQLALKRLTMLLESKGASVSVLHLPHDDDSSKTGVDDFLATHPENERVAKLRAHVEPSSFRFGTPQEAIGTHPKTGQKLLTPRNYVNNADDLAYVDPVTGKTKQFYSGYLVVTATGTDRHTGEESLTVGFRHRGQDVRVAAPRSKIATSRGVIEHLGAKGAAVHEQNARQVAAYLIEFAQQNAHALPVVSNSDTYGFLGDGILGPGWSVGIEAEYTGLARIEVRNDRDAYRSALVEILSWGEKAWPLWLLIGLSAAAPFLELVRPRRNPVVWLWGNSNSGKSTAAQFAIALFGDPEKRPLLSQAGRTSWAGFIQEMRVLRGFPIFIDETHTADPATLQNIVYQFANKQAYTKGGKDGHARGGDVLSGVAFLAGEAPPDFRHEGSRNRALTIDTTKHPPLGSLTSPERSDVLVRASATGAGTWAEPVARHIWEQRSTLVDFVSRAERKYRHDLPGHEWIRSLLAAKEALKYMLEVMGVPVDGLIELLPEKALTAVEQNRMQNDPAFEAFEQVRTLVLNAPLDIRDGHFRLHRHQRFAYVAGFGEALIISGSDAFKEALKTYGGSQGVLSKWAQRGWIMTDQAGKSTVVRTIDGKKQRCVVIPRHILEDGPSLLESIEYFDPMEA